MQYAQLIEILQKGNKRKRELDVLIWAFVNEYDVRWNDHELIARNKNLPNDIRVAQRMENGDVHAVYPINSGIYYPRYTSSLDAAMTLIPEGWSPHTAHFGKTNHANWVICRTNDCTDSIESEHDDKAIALCLAALEAIHRERTGGKKKSAGQRLIDVAKEARDWFKKREDCDHDGVKYVPNDEMRLGVELDRALADMGEEE